MFTKTFKIKNTGSGRSNGSLSMVNNMGVIIYSFNLNISPKMSYGELECAIAYRITCL